MTTNHTKAPFAAAVYKPDTGDRMALMKFAEKQKSLNTRVGGVLQEALFNSEGGVVGLNAIDVLTNRRNAINDRLDLVVEKFGELEQNGKGLIDEILQTAPLVEFYRQEGLLVSVPTSDLDQVLAAIKERLGN
jgi:hypothetical protein